MARFVTGTITILTVAAAGWIWAVGFLLPASLVVLWIAVALVAAESGVRRLLAGTVVRDASTERSRLHWSCPAALSSILLPSAVVYVVEPQLGASDYVQAMTVVLLTIAIAPFIVAKHRFSRSLPGKALFAVVSLLFVHDLAMEVISFRSSKPGTTVEIAPPFESAVVVQGGRSPLTNAHYFAPGQRGALDLLTVSRDSAEAVPCEGETVVSPLNGYVVRTVGGSGDGYASGLEQRAGEFVVLRRARTPGEGGSACSWVMLAHLQRNSIVVRAGDRVAVGQPLAACGRTGSASTSHLHVQAQDSAELTASTGTCALRFENAPRVARRGDLVFR